MLTYLLVVLPLAWIAIKSVGLEEPDLPAAVAAGRARLSRTIRTQNARTLRYSRFFDRDATIRLVAKPPTVVDLTWSHDLVLVRDQRQARR